MKNKKNKRARFYNEEQEKRIVEEYRSGVRASILCEKYGYATKKSIMDKIKKYFPNSYNEIINTAKENQKTWFYSLKDITSQFDAYFIGLLMTDGYVSTERNQVGIDLIDEDCIKFLSKTIGKPYKTYVNQYNITGHPRHRLILESPSFKKEVARFGVVPNKSFTLFSPTLYKEEEKYLPYLIRGIIDGDGNVSPTSYGGASFFICSMSQTFINWLNDVLINKIFLEHLTISKSNTGLYRIGSAHQSDIRKIIVLCYDKPFGMMRKYEQIRQTFRDYNTDFLTV